MPNNVDDDDSLGWNTMYTWFVALGELITNIWLMHFSPKMCFLRNKYSFDAKWAVYMDVV